MAGFRYTTTEWSDDRTICHFSYEMDGAGQTFSLTEKIVFPAAIPTSRESEQLTRALHIALGISYYKAFVAEEIEHPYQMDATEAAFWNSVFLNGLGEFLLKNQLDPRMIATFTEQGGTASLDKTETTLDDSVLLGLGGGKDSILAGELLKDLGFSVEAFVLATGEQRGQTEAVAEVMQVDIHRIERYLDKQIIEINQLDGAYNGHIPISLIFALCGCMLAIGKGQKYVVVANEASASLPQAVYQGRSINHQWSKSLEFERLLQDYLYSYVSNDLHYFSAIRPLTSLGVMQLFTDYPQYFEVFTSDNSLFRIKQEKREHPRWSTDSPKSLSSYILLAPLLTEEQLLQIFGRDFLDIADLEKLFISMLGRSSQQVLDCVGTPDELLYSLQQLERQGRFAHSALMKKARAEGLFKEISQLDEQPRITGEHAFPTAISDSLTDHITQRLEGDS